MSRQKTMQPAPCRPAFGNLQQTRELMTSLLKGKRIIVVTEDRYLVNESKLFSRTLALFGAQGAAIPYSDLLSRPKDLKPDILILRSSRLFMLAFQDILSSLKLFRQANPGAAVVACVLDAKAYHALSAMPSLVNVLDNGLGTDYELMKKGAQAQSRMQ